LLTNSRIYTHYQHLLANYQLLGEASSEIELVSFNNEEIAKEHDSIQKTTTKKQPRKWLTYQQFDEMGQKLFKHR